MTETLSKTSLHERHFKTLNCHPNSPSLRFLEELVAAQLATFPYESGSKLLHKQAGICRIPSREEFLSGHSEFGFGGTCFVQNAYFTELLVELGFDAVLIGMIPGEKENSHVACRVRIDSIHYLVDLGIMSAFAGPFSLSGPQVEMLEGARKWVFRPTGDGLNFVRTLEKDGEVVRRHASHSEPRTLDFFASGIGESFSEDAVFMQNFCLFHSVRGITRTIWNDRYIKEDDGTLTKTVVTDLAQLQSIIADEFGLKNYPTARVISAFEELGNRPFFTTSA